MNHEDISVIICYIIITPYFAPSITPAKSPFFWLQHAKAVRKFALTGLLDGCNICSVEGTP